MYSQYLQESGFVQTYMMTIYFSVIIRRPAEHAQMLMARHQQQKPSEYSMSYKDTVTKGLLGLHRLQVL